jgi:hypothetical protein
LVSDKQVRLLRQRLMAGKTQEAAGRRRRDEHEERTHVAVRPGAVGGEAAAALADAS